MVLRNVENRLVVFCRMGIVLLSKVRYCKQNAYQHHTSVMFCNISSLNDLSGISLILQESSPKEGSHIRVLERVFEDSILSQ